MSQEAQRGGRDAAPADDDQPAADEGVALVQRYAPDLPRELLHAVLLALGVDIVTLSAAAGVNKSWRAAALHPRFWAHLPLKAPAFDPQPCWHFRNLTDVGLAVLVRRACGTVGDDEHKLVFLSVDWTTRVTLRGVLKALGGPRDDAGTPLLRGALDELRVAGLQIMAHDVDDAEALLLELQSYLRNDFLGLSDVSAIEQCTADMCTRLLGHERRGCADCGIALCEACFFYGAVVTCDHMCNTCFFSPAWPDYLINCSRCPRSHPDGRAFWYCFSCTSYCHGCAEFLCLDCQGEIQYFECAASDCRRGFCESCACAEDLNYMTWCAVCGQCYCYACAVANLLPAEHGEFSSESDEDNEPRPPDDDDEPRRLCPQCRGHR